MNELMREVCSFIIVKVTKKERPLMEAKYEKYGI